MNVLVLSGIFVMLLVIHSITCAEVRKLLQINMKNLWLIYLFLKDYGAPSFSDDSMSSDLEKPAKSKVLWFGPRFGKR
jgi:hypothetical protein